MYWAHKDLIKLFRWVRGTLLARRKPFAKGRCMDWKTIQIYRLLECGFGNIIGGVAKSLQNDESQSRDQISDGLEYSIAWPKHREQCGEALHRQSLQNLRINGIENVRVWHTVWSEVIQMNVRNRIAVRPEISFPVGLLCLNSCTIRCVEVRDSSVKDLTSSMGLTWSARLIS